MQSIAGPNKSLDKISYVQPSTIQPIPNISSSFNQTSTLSSEKIGQQREKCSNLFEAINAYGMGKRSQKNKQKEE